MVKTGNTAQGFPVTDTGHISFQQELNQCKIMFIPLDLVNRILIHSLKPVGRSSFWQAIDNLDLFKNKSAKLDKSRLINKELRENPTDVICVAIAEKPCLAINAQCKECDEESGAACRNIVALKVRTWQWHHKNILTLAVIKPARGRKRLIFEPAEVEQIELSNQHRMNTKWRRHRRKCFCQLESDLEQSFSFHFFFFFFCLIRKRNEGENFANWEEIWKRRRESLSKFI